MSHCYRWGRGIDGGAIGTGADTTGVAFSMSNRVRIDRPKKSEQGVR